MATRRRRRSKKWISWLFFLVLIAAAIVVCSMVFKAYFSDEKGESSSEIEGEGEDEKEKTEKDEPEEGEVVKKEEVVQYDGEDPNNSGEITGVITYAGVVNGNLMIRMNIDQYLLDGTCELRLEENGVEVYEDSAGLIDSAATVTCEGFDVPVSEIGGGTYQILIDVYSGEKSGTIIGEVGV